MDEYFKNINKYLEDYKIMESPNPVLPNEQCKLINKKKEKYYIHTYDPSNLEKLMKENQNLFPEMYDTFDFTVRKNCCNCVSISIYYVSKKDDEFNNPNKFINYIGSIRRTVMNVKKNLPDWLVRIYMDESVYMLYNKMEESISNLKEKEPLFKKSIKYYNDIINADNVEIYTYLCPKILSGDIRISRTRTFRFLPFCDPEVNVAISREADGFVTNLDCHNIRYFEKSKDKYLYILSIGLPTNLKDTKPYNFFSYSDWLNIYKLVMNKKYFEKKQNLMDLLAGATGLKLKIKLSKYNEVANSIQQKINDIINKNEKSEYYNNYNNIKDLANQNYDLLLKIFRVLRDNDILNIGFDEMLLLELLKDLISVKYKIKKDSHSIAGIINRIEYDNQDYEIIKNFILAPEFMTTYKYDSVEGLDILKDLISKKIINYNVEEISKEYNYKLNLIKDQCSFNLNLCDLYIIDSFLVANKILTNQPFNVTIFLYQAGWRDVENVSLLYLLNVPYSGIGRMNNFVEIENIDIFDQAYDNFNKNNDKIIGGYFAKYIKYKSKYLFLKKKLVD